MKKAQVIVQWMLVGLLLVTGCTTPTTPASQEPLGKEATGAAVTPSAAAPSETPEQAKADPAVEALDGACAQVSPGQACIGQAPVDLEAQPERYLMPYQKPGDTFNLVDIRRLRLGSPGSKEGLALLKIQTEHPGAVLTVVAFGDVELENQVPFGTSEFAGMQALSLATGPEGEGEPSGGLLVQAPGDGRLHTLVVNGAELTFGSTAFITSWAGSLVIHTVAGAVMLSAPGIVEEIVQGTVFSLSEEQLLQGLVKEPPRIDPAFEMINRALARYYGLFPVGVEPYEDPKIKMVLDALKKYEEQRKRLKAWKGGWWKKTYGPTTITGQCLSPAYGDGDGSGFSQEIPICRGNNGNTLLMYDNGSRFDRVQPNLFASGRIEELQEWGASQVVTTGSLDTIQVLSPTRMILTVTGSEAGGCSLSHIIYLDFVHEDPDVRCARVIDVSPFITPMPTPTLLPVQAVLPPVEAIHTFRLAAPTAGCDPEALALAPDISQARLVLQPDGSLVIEAASGRYALTQADQTFNTYSNVTRERERRYGIFSLVKLLADPFTLFLTVMQVSERQWGGSWLVTDASGSKYCGGPLSLIAPE